MVSMNFDSELRYRPTFLPLSGAPSGATGAHFRRPTGLGTETASTIGESSSAPEGRPVRLDWYFDAISKGEDVELSVVELAVYIKGINDMVGHKQYFLLNKLLRDSIGKETPSEALIAFARAAFPVRSKISGWKVFLSGVKNRLESNGRDGERLLKGLS